MLHKAMGGGGGVSMFGSACFSIIKMHSPNCLFYEVWKGQISLYVEEIQGVVAPPPSRF